MAGRLKESKDLKDRAQEHASWVEKEEDVLTESGMSRTNGVDRLLVAKAWSDADVGALCVEQDSLTESLSARGAELY